MAQDKVECYDKAVIYEPADVYEKPRLRKIDGEWTWTSRPMSREEIDQAQAERDLAQLERDLVESKQGWGRGGQISLFVPTHESPITSFLYFFVAIPTLSALLGTGLALLITEVILGS